MDQEWTGHRFCGALLHYLEEDMSKKKKQEKRKKQKYEGVFTSNPRGFGFVTVEGFEEDFYVPAKCVNGAIHGDTVKVELLPPKGKGKGRIEVRVKKIIDHELKKTVGTFERVKSYGFVKPDDERLTRDIYVPLSESMEASTGEKVVCLITDYGSENKSPEGVVTEILGDANAPGTDILSLLKSRDIPTEFPEKVISEVKDIPDHVTEKEIKGRRDLRDVQMVTIDGEDSKDLDDAVSLSKEGDNYILGVHIADVSHYVREKTPLDKEALHRGTSVYLADRVVPMLPKELSNGICSLNEGVDRLALSCVMTIDKKGNVIDHKIFESVVNIDRRMTYTSVKKILVDKDKDEKKKYKELVPLFKLMEKASKVIRKEREKRGSIDFDFTESKLIVDETGKVTDIKPYEISVANKIIEDFMIAANETVAKDCFDKHLPFLYRTHGKPDPDKIETLSVFLKNMGHSLYKEPRDVKPKDIRKMLKGIAGTPEEAVILRLTLRSMQQARYTTENNGHFGLASENYTHFTSPIRRYPDLQIHRIIKEYLHKDLNEKRMGHYESILPDVARKTSERERRADEAERDAEKMKKAEYMLSHIGDIYEGTVSGVTDWGIYVELENTVEGLVKASTLKDDYYRFIEASMELKGERTGRIFSLGQKVRIQVTGANKGAGTVDFILSE